MERIKVPALKLGNLSDEDTKLVKPAAKQTMVTPNTSSTVSWGTTYHTPLAPRVTSQILQNNGDVTGYIQKDNRPQEHSSNDNIVFQKEMIDDDDQGNGCKYRSANPKTQTTEEELDKNVQMLYYNDNNSFSEQKWKMKMAAEQLEADKKWLLVIDTVLTDQLSRAAISDPAQNANIAYPELQLPYRRNRRLHDTLVVTSNIANERVLSNKVRFGARVHCRDGHDAIRELYGLFFTLDSSLTIYEFRQFGKKAVALPFIKRGVYRHLQGPKADSPYTLWDINAGRNLCFVSNEQNYLPATLKANPVTVLRVTDVDEEEQHKVLFSQMRRSDKAEALAQLHSKAVTEDSRLLSPIQADIRQRLRKRGVKTMTGLGRLFRSLDKSGDGCLTRAELKKAAETFKLSILADKFEQLWLLLDQNANGTIDYKEFSHGVVGEMNELCKHLVLKAFRKIDTDRNGVISFDEITKFFNSTNSAASSASGGQRSDETLESFLQMFNPAVRQCAKTPTPEITFAEFDDYYEGLRMEMADDNDFARIMQITWGI